MTMRIFLAGVLGAIAMFLWSAVAHMALPLGEAGIREIPHEAAVMATLQSNIGDTSGLFVFPGTGLGPDATKAQKEEAMRKMGEDFATKSSGLLMYNPPGTPFAFGKRLGIEFATELLESLLAVFLLARAGIAGFGARAGFVLLLGILAAVATNLSYWNWYGFPSVYTAGYMTIQVVGFLLAGLVFGLVLKNTPLPRPIS